MAELTPNEQQQIAQVYRDVCRQIKANGNETLSALVRQTEDLFARNPHWTECQRTSRRRAILDMWGREQSKQTPVPNAPVPAREAPEPVDLVIPLSNASKGGRDRELKYLLRSAEQHIRGLRKVWILGTHRPSWLTGVEFVDVADNQKRKSWNILRKFRALLDCDTTDRFIKASDDTVFLTPIDVDTWTVVKGKQLRQVTPGKRSSFWTKCHSRTRDWLAAHGFGTVNHDTHAPCVLSQGGLQGMFDVFTEDEWRKGRGWALWSLYYNITPPTQGEVCLCRKTKVTFERSARSETIEQVRRRCRGKLFAGYNNPGLTDQLLAYFEACFPSPSRFELSDELTPEAGGPSRSFTWQSAPVERPATGAEHVLDDIAHEAPVADVLAAVSRDCQHPLVVLSPDRAAEVTPWFKDRASRIETVTAEAPSAIEAQIRLRLHVGVIKEVVLLLPGCGPELRESLGSDIGLPVYDLHDAIWRRPEPPPSLEEVAFIVPIRDLQADSDRMASFEFVIGRILDAHPGEVIVVEQLRPGQSRLALPGGCRSVVLESMEEGIEKSKLINMAAQEATKAVLWIHDADCWVPFLEVMRQVGDEEAIKPFREVWRLNADQTAQLFSDGAVVCSRPKKRSNNWGGGSLIVRREKFLAIRGYDERFIGWGGEDNDFGDRVQQSLRTAELSGVICLHLWHDRDRGQLLRSSDGARKLRTARAMTPVERIRDVVGPFPLPEATTAPPDQPPRFAPIEVTPRAAERCERETVMVIPFYPPANAAERDMRSRALHRTAERILSVQQHLPLIVIVELVDRQAYAADIVHPRVVYHPISVGTENAALMQKEASLNAILARYARENDIISDDDIWSPDPWWLVGIVDRIKSGTIVHGFGWIADTRSDRCWWSYGHWQEHGGKGNVAKGGTYGFSHALWEAIGGLNYLAFAGGGDALLLEELVAGKHTSDVRAFGERPSIVSVIRPGLPKYALTHCPTVVYHEHHGDHKLRAYTGRMTLMDRFANVSDHVRLGRSGLLEWRRPGCLLQRCLERRSELQTTDDVDRILIEELRRGAIL